MNKPLECLEELNWGDLPYRTLYFITGQDKYGVVTRQYKNYVMELRWVKYQHNPTRGYQSLSEEEFWVAFESFTFEQQTEILFNMDSICRWFR